MSARAAVGRLLLWLGAELAGVAALSWLVRPTVGREPLDVAAWIGRWLALALLASLLLVTVAQLLALAMGVVAGTGGVGARLARASARLGPRGLAGLAAAATVVSGASSCAPAMARAARHDVVAREPVVMVLEAPPGSGSVPPGQSGSVVTMEIDPEPSPLADPAPFTDPAPVPAPPRTVEVLRGDSLWSIAERSLSDSLGRAPSDAETTTYWRIVVELNRTRLVDPDDPSRIYAGQRIVLP
ncbi:LysM peptidoglycan-binding domain-containing protein [Dermatobacter hominis]|uniref:LysM peptidoglycan-binding domain-containing protein n=1 Tax=Dermatobacter hominis TaxID=2884263 RepID=UPI001D12A55F|nr:LysM peptidoglycan-binding domain-containing protein [Dermatobacter hominis]UDY35788.1 LysM peptidoglycan-binding domain-containing protein [Dermatobacter hominis]